MTIISWSAVSKTSTNCMILGCRKRLIISTSLLNLEGLNRSLSRKGRKSTTYRIVRNHYDTISRYTAAIVTALGADNFITFEIHKDCQTLKRYGIY